MSLSIYLLKESLSNINHNINVYEKMDSNHITDQDRNITLTDLYKLKKELETNIKKIS